GGPFELPPAYQEAGIRSYSRNFQMDSIGELKTNCARSTRRSTHGCRCTSKAVGATDANVANLHGCGRGATTASRVAMRDAEGCAATRRARRYLKMPRSTPGRGAGRMAAR